MMNDTLQPLREQGAMAEFDFGEYIANATSNDTQHTSNLEMFNNFNQQPRNNSQVTLDANLTNQSLLANQPRLDHVSQVQPQNMLSAEMLTLKGRLEEQIKLQQLQQLILQQQIALISGQPLINTQQKEAIFNGLLTPGPSADLPAVVPKDLVPPMMLQSEIFINNNTPVTSMVNSLSPHSHAVNPSFSAPAALAFPTSPPFPLPSPAQPEYDLPPLTSPWILPGAAQHRQQQQQQQQQQQYQQQPSQPHAHQQRLDLKRSMSSSDDDDDEERNTSVRKRPSSHVNSSGLVRSKSHHSMPPTPAMMAPGSGRTQLSAPSKDTPSPVDLSMPHHTAYAEHNNARTASAASPSATISGTASTSVSPDIAPMTPASILNLRKLSTGLISPSLDLANAEKKDTPGAARKTGKPKSATKSAPSVANRGRRGSIAKPGVSPSMKPLLPGVPPTPISPLSHASTSSSHAPSSSFALLPGDGGSSHNSSTSHTAPGPRKTSHKAAEQKRRDSLKTSFDELRLLLPPMPLLPEDGGDDPPLPGSMPPRGPPKGDADGPNRGVSKLALLRCGNSYIRELMGKVLRRDREIDALREEVRRLRGVLGGPEGAGAAGVVGMLDLERDVDGDGDSPPARTLVGGKIVGVGVVGVAEEKRAEGKEDGLS